MSDMTGERKRKGNHRQEIKKKDANSLLLVVV